MHYELINISRSLYLLVCMCCASAGACVCARVCVCVVAIITNKPLYIHMFPRQH